MKGNINKLALGVIIAAIPMFIAVATASAGPTYITGEYAGTATAQCLIAPVGFATNLTPNPMPAGAPGAGTIQVVVYTLTWDEVYTFNRNGTGSVAGVTYINELPNAVLGTPAAAGSGNVSYDFTYTLSDGDITLALAKGSFNCTAWVSGVNQGTTNCADNIPLHGVISKDGKTITVTCGPPTAGALLNAVDPSTGEPLGPQLSCVYSGVFVEQ